MSIEQDTGNEQKLPLAERARRGLLASEPELSVTEISELEHPTDSAARKGFHAALCVECDFGSLTAEKKLYHDYHEPLVIESVPGIHAEFYSALAAFSDSPRRSRAPTDWSTPPVWVVSRESYRAWRAQCPATLLSEPRLIKKWLGATPVPESLHVESLLVESLPEPTASSNKKGKAALKALLDEVDKRAAEQGAGFTRNSLPGTKKEFHALAIKYNHHAFSKALSTFDSYLHGLCQFESAGVKPEHGKGAAIWALFPEYHFETRVKKSP